MRFWVKIEATFYCASWSRAVRLTEVLMASYNPGSPTLFAGDTMIPLSEFPVIDATLNGTSAALLTLGYFFGCPAGGPLRSAP